MYPQLIDSGTTYTLFPEAVLELIAAEFDSHITYPKDKGYEMCYNVSGVANSSIKFPEFGFHLSGGSDMVIPQGNVLHLLHLGIWVKH